MSSDQAERSSSLAAIPNEAVPVVFPIEKVRLEVFGSNALVQEQFRTALSTEIERAIAGIAAAHRALDLFRANLKPSAQVATLELFLHSSVHALLCSVHHLVSGYPIASGNMMRHYTESVAMVLLCLEPKLGVLDAYSKDRSAYPVHKAPTRLRQRDVRAALKAMIDFDEAAWETILEIAKLYDQLSHASTLALGHQQLFSAESMMILGGEFDPAKKEPYRADLARRSSAAESLAHMISVVTDALQEEAV